MQQLGKKLQLNKEHHTLLLNAPVSVAQLLSGEGYAVTTDESKSTKFDAVQVFVHNKEELIKLAQRAINSLKPSGLLWVAYPKKSSGMGSDLTRDEGWKVIAAMGYEAVRQVAIDEVWSSLRFKHASKRKEPSKMGAVYPGIDKENRTVNPPADLQEALDEAGLTSKFQAMSFTCKKEYVLAVLEAKREETRAKRIINTIDQLAKK